VKYLLSGKQNVTGAMAQAQKKERREALFSKSLTFN
jgi:hypothetical protein